MDYVLMLDWIYEKRRSTFALLTLSLYASSQTIDLSKQPWRLWLDETAEYFNDSLYLPPYNMDVIPCTPPTCGCRIFTIIKMR